MSENIKTNTQGETNVKDMSGDNATMHDEFDLSNADIKRSGKGGWNDFEIDNQEGERTGNEDTQVAEDIKERIRASHVGRMVLRLGPSLKIAA